jgi:hypothetical protein
VILPSGHLGHASYGNLGKPRKRGGFQVVYIWLPTWFTGKYKFVNGVLGREVKNGDIRLALAVSRQLEGVGVSRLSRARAVATYDLLL